MCPEKTKIERDTCTPVFTAALFTIAGHGNSLDVHRQMNGYTNCGTCIQGTVTQPDEWIQKFWYIYTMDCYSALKKNTFESVLMRQKT